MPAEKPYRRMTLQQLLVHAEKCSRDMSEQIRSGYLPRAADSRELSRPVRRKSHYPTLLALLNALSNLDEASKEIDEKADQLGQQMQIIRDSARRERINRA
jgi:hypothetical protein